MDAEELWETLMQFNQHQKEKFEILISTPMGLFKLDEETPVFPLGRNNSLVIKTGKLWE